MFCGRTSREIIVWTDRLADAAARRHHFPVGMHLEADLRKDLALQVQSHLVRSWFAWCDIQREEVSNEINQPHLPSAFGQTGLCDPAAEFAGQHLDDWLGDQLDDPVFQDPVDELAHQEEDPEFDQCPCDFGFVSMDVEENRASTPACHRADDAVQDASPSAVAPESIDMDVQCTTTDANCGVCSEESNLAPLPHSKNASLEKQVVRDVSNSQLFLPTPSSAGIEHVPVTYAPSSQYNKQVLGCAHHDDISSVGSTSGGTPCHRLSEGIRGGMGLPADEVPTEMPSVGLHGVHHQAPNLQVQVPAGSPMQCRDDNVAEDLPPVAPPLSPSRILRLLANKVMHRLEISNGACSDDPIWDTDFIVSILDNVDAVDSASDRNVNGLSSMALLASTDNIPLINPPPSDAPLCANDVRGYHATGFDLTGSHKEISEKLRQVCPLYSWTPPEEAGIKIVFATDFKLNDPLVPRQGFLRSEALAVKTWLENAEFTLKFGKLKKGAASRANRTTFIELVIAIEVDTAVGIGGTEADLARKVTLLRNILRYLMCECRPSTNDRACRNKKVSFEDFFAPVKYCRSLEPISGERHAGFSGGVVWDHSDEIVGIIAARSYQAAQNFHNNIAKHHQDDSISGLHNRQLPFGTDFLLRIPRNSIPVMWRPDALLALQSAVAQSYELHRPAGGICFFGCSSRAKLKSQNLVPKWRGAVLGSGICTKCHNRLFGDLRNPSIPLVTEGGLGPSLRTRLTGPCVFGCTTSALDNSFKGKMQWHSAPTPCVWPGVSAGDVLCNACYCGFRFHSAKPGKTLPKEEWASSKRKALAAASLASLKDRLPLPALGDAPGDNSAKPSESAQNANHTQERPAKMICIGNGNCQQTPDHNNHVRTPQTNDHAKSNTGTQAPQVQTCPDINADLSKRSVNSEQQAQSTTRCEGGKTQKFLRRNASRGNYAVGDLSKISSSSICGEAQGGTAPALEESGAPFHNTFSAHSGEPSSVDHQQQSTTRCEGGKTHEFPQRNARAYIITIHLRTPAAVV